MRKCSSFGGLCTATVIVAAIMSIEFGDWGIWIPVLLALASSPACDRPCRGDVIAENLGKGYVEV
jgi:hypothetical protein